MGQSLGIEAFVGNFPLQLAASCVACAGFQGLRWVVDPIAFKHAPKLGAKTADEQLKFSSQLVNFAFHIGAGGWLAKIIYSNGWLDSAEKIWEFYHTGEPNATYLSIYVLQFGYHLQRLVQLFAKKKKKDFLEMLVHHVVTIFLLGFSSWAGYVRVGMCVLMVHDLSDALGCSCKIFSALNWKKCLIGSFLPMKASWAYTRLYILPFKIIPICHQCPAGPTSFSVISCVSALYVLVGLNGYWYILFCRMLWRLATKGATADIQEDSKGEKSIDHDGKKGN